MHLSAYMVIFFKNEGDFILNVKFKIYWISYGQ